MPGERVDPVEAYAAQWEAGAKTFSQGTKGAVTTKFLDDVHKLIEDGWDEAEFGGVDLGAGSGEHAVALAERHPLASFTAVESSDVAVDGIKQLASVRLGEEGESLTVFHGNLFDFLEKAGDRSLQLIYMNSILHFLSDQERTEVLRHSQRVLSEGGLLAVSFKREGDSLEEKGEELGRSELGRVVRGDNGITRVFMDPDDGAYIFANQLGQEGFKLVEKPVKWKVKGYDGEGEKARFIGFIASKSTKDSQTTTS